MRRLSNQNNYLHLFPFENVPKGARILLYGAGRVGQAYLQQAEMTGYCDVIGFVDRNYRKLQDFRLPVYAPEQIAALSFDYIVVAMVNPEFLPEVDVCLARIGVPKEKILHGKRREPALPLRCVKASERRPLSVLLWLSGGIGDITCNKKVVETLLALCPELHIDLCYYGSHAFLKFLYQETPQVERMFTASAWKWYEEHQDFYGLAAELIGPRGAVVDAFHSECFRSVPAFLKQLERFVEVAARHTDVGGTSPLGIYLRRAMYRGMNCYTVYGEDGSLPIHDKHVQIPQSAEGKATFARFGLGRYITLNNGNGDPQGLDIVAKSWPQKYYEAFVEQFHVSYPDIEVVQIGSADCMRVAGTDHVVCGESFDVVAEILRHAMFHLDIEGGLVHLATQLGTKCIVLFGPTPVSYYGYEENINLKAGRCHECYCLYPEINRCARDMAEPECMYSITPEMVMEAVRSYLDERPNASGK